MPLLLAHGWPDSFWRYSEVVPLLVDPGAHGGDPADAFDVVVPDMPGYGYSDRAPQDLDLIGVASLWAQLMDRLGYPSFGAAGGDISSSVVRRRPPRSASPTRRPVSPPGSSRSSTPGAVAAPTGRACSTATPC